MSQIRASFGSITTYLNYIVDKLQIYIFNIHGISGSKCASIILFDANTCFQLSWTAYSVIVILFYYKSMNPYKTQFVNLFSKLNIYEGKIYIL